MYTYQDLASHMRDEFLNEDAAAPSGSATTADAIAFLPSQVGVVRGALKNLRKQKNKWNLEVHEGEEQYIVKFEDQLSINVSKEHWGAFQEMFEGTIDNDAYLDLQVVLMERVQLTESQMIESRKEELYELVMHALGSREIQVTKAAAERWRNVFGCNEDITSTTNPVVALDNIQEFAEQYVENLLEENTDLGNLDILIEEFQYSQLGEGDCLVAARYRSMYEGTTLVFEARVSHKHDCSFTISVSDPEILDAVEEAYCDLPRIGNVLYPGVGQLLASDGVLEVIKETISNLPEEESADETL